MIIARTHSPANPHWRDFLSDVPYSLTDPSEVHDIVCSVEQLAMTVADDLLILSDATVADLDRLLLFAVIARRAADVDRLELSGGERAVLDAIVARVGQRLNRGAAQ